MYVTIYVTLTMSNLNLQKLLDFIIFDTLKIHHFALYIYTVVIYIRWHICMVVMYIIGYI
jgi:hypothetical protein